METDADRAEYLKAFGVPALTPSGRLLGIFDREHVLVEGADETMPTLLCRSLDVAALKLTRGSSVSVEAATFRVRDVQPDGTGMTRLVLGD